MTPAHQGQLSSFQETWSHLGGSDGKESACSAGDPGPIPESEGFRGEGHGNPLRGSCLENPIERGAWRAIVHGVTKELEVTE